MYKFYKSLSLLKITTKPWFYLININKNTNIVFTEFRTKRKKYRHLIPTAKLAPPPTDVPVSTTGVNAHKSDLIRFEDFVLRFEKKKFIHL